MKTTSGIRLTEFHPEDLDDVMQIEQTLFTLPWSRQSYEELSSLDALHIVVAKKADDLLAYMVFQEIEDEIELHNIGVRVDKQRQGIGALLMEELLRRARQHQVQHIYLLVRASNLQAIRLYEKYHFKGVGYRRSYYSDNQEDALVMRHSLFETISN
ncbi:MAG: ribosomal-protein-alanine N-acetyltransferase [Deltaproteobacteria bacterium CG_4_10_14_0_2_um_filter_43_8]|nr:MAG: ribosomal-protein-alanine N-acetyltransferase [Deltaproteobacteria bacterium CG11_big_fil_rev_8_21_14_0_20_42_23]PJA22201.1 MAG: ribosomal-protein-alanine N-acetyltransferase [Deltaproteobacteria bacterium CG_4_10_14_0_2_um_filter_43_8]PJC64467.1 MAG: ribosomal-protein-alanine N-acetyltransferase [Deltaproteobacteria bacterium CG_4_9_14_0_2_um_filter_42_21]